MEYIPSVRDDSNYKNNDYKQFKRNLSDPSMGEILEDIVEYSIDKKGFFLEQFPLISNISSIYNLSGKDYVFYINKKNIEKFGISCDKNDCNDYYHIDPNNWKRLCCNKKELEIEMCINNNKKNIKFKETNTMEELERINKLFINELM